MTSVPNGDRSLSSLTESLRLHLDELKFPTKNKSVPLWGNKCCPKMYLDKTVVCD